MAHKPKLNQKQTQNSVQQRDRFSTPNYAVDLLVPYIPKEVRNIWEPACGQLKISTRLGKSGYEVWSSDIMDSGHLVLNFLTDPFNTVGHSIHAIITNPPFSLKYKFIDKALEYNVPFAFLIPFDMCQKMARLFTLGCQGLVPTSRIDYITPTGLSGATGHTSYYHSLWLTYKFNLPNQLTFVELTKQMKEDI